MNRSTIIRCLTACVLILSFVGITATADRKPVAVKREAPKLKSAPDPSTAEWRKDPICQMVFFAVLEGLYTDGISSEVVDLIVPRQTDLDTNVKHSFVFRCPLCHATYEAFVQYQRRGAFHNATKKENTFGDGKIDPDILEGLKHKEPRPRVFAMGALIQPWIDRRIKSMRLNPKEKKELMDKFLAYAADGNSLFRFYKYNEKSIYRTWQFYGGCQACEAAKVIAQQMRTDAAKK